VGRPLLYCGAFRSCIAKLISEHELGFIIEMNTVGVIADMLEEFSYNKYKLQQMKEHAFQFYNRNFSKKIKYIIVNIIYIKITHREFAYALS
jgi:UDP-N-acetylglucosamine:LPS N-acetylglucosamine transferase